MAKITSHILNGLDGTHASGVCVSLQECDTGKTILESQTDEGGRLLLEAELAPVSEAKRYQLVFNTKDYWRAQGVSDENIIPEVVLRFDATKTGSTCHLPIILSPHSYSTWKSG